MDLLSNLQHYPVAAILLAALFGLCIGSFLNVVIYRLPIMMFRQWSEDLKSFEPGTIDLKPGEKNFNLATPSSKCPRCGSAITPLKNIPVFSYVFLRGRCAQCKSPISARYPSVEIATAILSAVVIFQFGMTLNGLLALFFTWSMIALTMIDYDHQLLPDSITLPLLWLGLLANINSTYVPLSHAVIGAAAGYLSLWSVYWAFKLVTGKEGMGQGDFKLLAAIGAWMGWKVLPLVIVLSSAVGAVIGIALIVMRRQDSQKPIPFGPYLAIAGWIAMLWGNEIINRYLAMYQG